MADVCMNFSQQNQVLWKAHKRCSDWNSCLAMHAIIPKVVNFYPALTGPEHLNHAQYHYPGMYCIQHYVYMYSFKSVSFTSTSIVYVLCNKTPSKQLCTKKIAFWTIFCTFTSPVTLFCTSLAFAPWHLTVRLLFRLDHFHKEFRIIYVTVFVYNCSSRATSSNMHCIMLWVAMPIIIINYARFSYLIGLSNFRASIPTLSLSVVTFIPETLPLYSKLIIDRQGSHSFVLIQWKELVTFFG